MKEELGERKKIKKTRKEERSKVRGEMRGSEGKEG